MYACLCGTRCVLEHWLQEARATRYGGHGAMLTEPAMGRPKSPWRGRGPEALSAETVAAYVARDPIVRGAWRPATQRAMAYLSTFAK